MREAIIDFKLDEIEVIIYIEGQSKNTNQIVRKIKELKRKAKTKVTYLDYDEVKGKDLKKRINQYSSILNSIRNKSYSYLFFSDFRTQWQKDFVETLRNDETFLIDDGAITLAFMKYHMPSKTYFSIPNYGTVERRKEAEKIKTEEGICSKPLDNIKVYTIFHHTRDFKGELKKNNLTHLRKSFSSLDEEAAIIIGAKIVQRGFMTLELYDKLTKKIISNCKKEKVYYIPHRGQPEEYVDYILSNNPELILLKTSEPVEDWLSKQVTPPSSIHGYASTAFYIINLSFPQIRLYCYKPLDVTLNDFNLPGKFGSTLYTNSDAALLTYDEMPKEVSKIEMNI
ncbi:hypothetical protein [Bowmanella pacifica]|uniref:hypothetical protein n=1 Tax=Bowmanella pacifica TaxID=502051 RepID=UPI00166DCE89|nr:hypothetical protein [Bowmanella pacifica]